VTGWEKEHARLCKRDKISVSRNVEKMSRGQHNNTRDNHRLNKEATGWRKGMAPRIDKQKLHHKTVVRHPIDSWDKGNKDTLLSRLLLTAHAGQQEGVAK